MGEPASPLGLPGLRLAFWLSGLHDTFDERTRRGETLSEREASLLALSFKDFAALRPTVVGMALQRLQAVLSGPEFSNLATLPPAGGDGVGPMEVFAIEAMRNLAQRAQQPYREKGPSAALSLFGGGEDAVKPLEIFQIVFSTASAMADGFARLVPGTSELLSHLARVLGTDVERV